MRGEGGGQAGGAAQDRACDAMVAFRLLVIVHHVASAVARALWRAKSR